MNIQIPGGGKAVGSVFNLLVDWEVPGLQSRIHEAKPGGKEHTTWQAVEMNHEYGGFDTFRVGERPYPLFQIRTRQDDWCVYLIETVENEENCSPEKLPARAKELLELPRTMLRCEKVTFPVVAMSDGVDVSWLTGMSVPGFRIDEAVKKVKLRLDEKGARAESAVASITRSGGEASYVVDRSFYVIFMKDGLNFPAFVATAERDSWVKEKE